MSENVYQNAVSNNGYRFSIDTDNQNQGAFSTPQAFQINANPVQRKQDSADIIQREEDSHWYNTLWNYATDNVIGTGLSLAGQATNTMGGMWSGVSALERAGMGTMTARNVMGGVRGAGNIGNLLAPLGLVSETSGLMENILGTGDAANRSTAERLGSGAANTAALTSSVIGSTALATEGITALGFGSSVSTLGPLASSLGPLGAVLGAFAGGYALGDYINEKTGWSQSLAERADRNRNTYADMGLGDTSSTVLGGAANIPVLSEVGQGLGWLGYQVYDKGGTALSAAGDGIETAGGWALNHAEEAVNGVSDFASDNWTLDTDEIDWGRTFDPSSWF